MINEDFLKNIPERQFEWWWLCVTRRNQNTRCRLLNSFETVLKGRRNIFGTFWHSSEVFGQLGKSSEAAGTFMNDDPSKAEISRIDPEKVGRYLVVYLQKERHSFHNLQKILSKYVSVYVYMSPRWKVTTDCGPVIMPPLRDGFEIKWCFCAIKNYDNLWHCLWRTLGHLLVPRGWPINGGSTVRTHSHIHHLC